MTKLIEVQLDDESTIYIEVEDNHSTQGPETAASFNTNEIETKGKEYLEKAFETIKKMSASFKSAIKDFGSDKPAEVELSLNIKLSTESKVILSTLGAEGNFGVKLKWKNEND